MAAGLLFATPAVAADIGGSCCSDLEDRVTELEAITAHKGNRKVSVKISGHVARAIVWTDDDEEFHVIDSPVSGSRIQFSGTANLTKGWTAGYVLRLRYDGEDDSAYFDRNYVSIGHKNLGTVATGLMAAPTYEIASISLAGRAITGDANDIAELENVTGNAIAYISPTLAGFHAAIAWIDVGPDDVIDMSLRFAREMGNIRVAAGIGYHGTQDDFGNGVTLGSAAIMDVVSGLNIAGSASNVGDDTAWHVQGGVNKNFFGPGNTSLYAEYGRINTDSDKMWGLGVVQHVDKAATELFLAYRNWHDEANQVTGGARIKF